MSRIYPNRPGGKPLAELTTADVADLDARDLAALSDEAQARAAEIHAAAPDGQYRSQADADEFRHCLDLRDAAETHRQILRNIGNPRAMVRGDGAPMPGQPGYRGQVSRRFAPSPEFMRQSQWAVSNLHDVFRLGAAECRDRALSALEERGEDLGLAPDQLDLADSLLRSALSQENVNCDGDYIARRALITESPAYRSAFREGMTRPHPRFTSEEIDALRALERLEMRAMSEGSTTSGGFGVPVFIDPTIVLSAGAGAAPILDVCRVDRITTSQWKGVSSAGMSWSWDAEGSAVSDDTPTLAQPVVPVYMGRGFLPYSIELGQDYPGFAEQMAALLAQGSLDLLAASTVTGPGTTAPTGIVTKLQATAGSQVRVTTAGSVGAADVFKVWNALPERFRSQPSTGWGMSVSVESTIRQFSTPTSSSAYFTVDLTQEGVTMLNGKKVTRSDYFPTITGSTATQGFAVVGDWKNYLVAMRAGMQIEPIPTLFDVTTGRPTGQRGYFAWLRSGHDCINPPAFRILDQT